jgi:phosphatidylinositol 4-kinase
METLEVGELDPQVVESEGTESTECLSPELIGPLPYAEQTATNYEEAKFAGFQEYIAEVQPTEEAAGPELVHSQSESEWVDPWGEPFEDVKERLRKASPFGRYSSWRLRAMIVKGHDDLRQELLAMQFISSVHMIFLTAGLKLWLQPYEILIISNDAGLIEFVPDTQSLDGIKKNSRHYTNLLGFFKECWGACFEEAQKNFVESMAGYSLICYLLNIKDRHNGNILLDRSGHILHIDFGFMLTNSPGNMGFESAPFKLTMEMLDVMGGYHGELFHYYKVLLFQGFVELRKHSEHLCLLVEMMYPGERLPCFTDRERVMGELRERFMLNKTEEQCLASVEALVSSAAGNWRTNRYDSFQRLTNGIV